MAEIKKTSYPIGKTPYRISICDHILDTIYGQVGLTKVERELEKLSIFKRLHNISQLGLVNWIFPCALHTRYTHSIGVMHVAGEMALHINANTGSSTPFFDDDDIQIIRLAGMLHDIGHYPMSHNVELAYRHASDSEKKLKDSKTAPVDRLQEITHCPNYLNPLHNPADTPKRHDGMSDKELNALRSLEKDKRLKADKDYFQDFTGSIGHHHENIGNLIIISNKSIHDTVRDYYVLTCEGGRTVLNPKFAPEGAVEVSKEQADEITNQLLQAIGQIVRGNYENATPSKLPWLEKYSAMVQLIHSELDADNLDYLLRDATFSGTSYGIMDMGILLNCMTVSRFHESQGGTYTDKMRYIVGIKKKGVGCVEQFLLNKFLAYTQMILSKYVSILEAMLLCFEEDYVIPNEEPDNGDYSCEGLENLVKREDPATKFYGFSDHYIFQKIYDYKKNAAAMTRLPKAIVSQLNGLRAFEMANEDENEFICTGFSEDEIAQRVKQTVIYQRFSRLCLEVRQKEDELEQKGADADDKKTEYELDKVKLFPYRFERYSLTKQLPLDEFCNRFPFHDMNSDRRFNFHYYRLADGIPILDDTDYDYDSTYSYQEDLLNLEENAASHFHLPRLCVDSEQSCLHQIYSMQYVSLRQYQINSNP